MLKVTEENCEYLAKLTAEETGMPIEAMRTFFQAAIGQMFTDNRLKNNINAFLDDFMMTIVLDNDSSIEMSIDDDGRLFFYSKEDPDDIVYPQDELE